MKRQLILTTLGSLVLSASLISHADDAAPTAEPTATPSDATIEMVAEAQPAAPAEVLLAEVGEMPPAAAESIVVEEAAKPAADAEPERVTGPAADEAILIVIDDTPLLDAIRNLARQANINLVIDPKVGYGQTDTTGKSIPQPNVSIRWENITAEQALNALLNNYDLQAVQDPKINITRITVKDPAAPDPLKTQTIQLQYASPSNVMAAVTATFTDKRSKVVADVRTSQLVVVTTEKEMVEVEKLVAKLDSPTKQVLIEARLVETTMNPSTVKGIDWTGTLAAQKLAFGNNLRTKFVSEEESVNPTLATVAPRVLLGDGAGSFGAGPAAAFLDADGVSAVFSFLNQNTDTKILSSPRTVTLDNETAVIEAGTLFPIVNVTAGTVQTSGGSQIAYSNLTVRLDVTPRISANNLINLKVTPTVMRLLDVQTFDAGEGTFDVPIFATRNIDTRVMIPSGNTLVMGGLVQDEQSNRHVKVPILGDLPFLGALFRQNAKSRDKSNLIVFVTPTIVQDEDFQPTVTDYLKTPVSTADFADDEWTALDSGKPTDWSKPRSTK